MAITATQSQHDGVERRAVGRYLDNAGTPAAPTINCGFKPRVVRWHNLTDRISKEWFEGMAADSALSTAADGVRSLATSGALTINAGSATVGAGFTVAAALVIQNKQYSWEAYA